MTNLMTDREPDLVEYGLMLDGVLLHVDTTRDSNGEVYDLTMPDLYKATYGEFTTSSVMFVLESYLIPQGFLAQHRSGTLGTDYTGPKVMPVAIHTWLSDITVHKVYRKLRIPQQVRRNAMVSTQVGVDVARPLYSYKGGLLTVGWLYYTVDDIKGQQVITVCECIARMDYVDYSEGMGRDTWEFLLLPLIATEVPAKLLEDRGQ